MLAVVGPRQSGKSTLVKAAFPDLPCANLEDPEVRAFAQSDPRGFLARFPDGAFLDEVQRCPDLFSYIQVAVGEKRKQCMFVLAGSQNFLLLEKVTQSLAGRVLFLTLLPFSLGELEAGGYPQRSLDTLLWTGCYPPIYDRKVEPGLWYNGYVTTYIERDVRQVLRIKDLDTFQRFMGLCAARTGQLLNYSSLATDCGVSLNTIKEWLSVLRASFVVHLLQPYHRNFSKRLVKHPKLYFLDTGLAAHLLRIRSVEELSLHPMRGALFENWVVAECLKRRYHSAQASNLFFWRNHTGEEVDLIADHGQKLLPIECKSGATVASDWFAPIRKFVELAGKAAEPPWLVYGGADRYQRESVEVVGWRKLAELLGEL